MADEIKRRLFHASSSIIPGLYLLEVLTWSQLGALMLAASAAVVGIELLRLRTGLDLWIFEKLTREYEQETVAGYALGAFSMTAVILAFEPAIAVPAILMLTIGDPVSGLLGTDELRTIKHPRSLAAMFVISLAIAWPFLSPAVAAVAALGAMVADGVKPRIGEFVVDDNLSIPLVAGGAAYVAVALVSVLA
ncbi:dolichol kinase [Natranaeroarchaeum aerophilus]|uniref:Dolichol kinase n=1 Tax=Natranaeroarchaeum aerophilus TaxID=2917711 RepID=A0AAE3FN85_9EURY|nr:dolichol kinase [Natranaeroarchaeum aerophilus]MCL9812116.1 dolichol kinase [Natranaeroarchaeum aerophilus]